MRRSRPIDPHQLVILNKRSEVKNLFVRCRQINHLQFAEKKII